MNKNHYTLTTWGLQHANIGDADTILDIGCGGGRTVQRLAAMASQGKVVGVDYADASVATSRRLNAVAIQSGSVEVQQASVSNLPFPDAAFDLVTAVEIYYYWPDRPGAMSEILRVLKPGGPDRRGLSRPELRSAIPNRHETARWRLPHSQRASRSIRQRRLHRIPSFSRSK